MRDISKFTSEGNWPTRGERQRATGQGAPSKKPRIEVALPDYTGAITSRIIVDGRDAWALNQLIRAGNRGCTPIDNPAPRWSHYVWKLRRAGLVIETHDEPHGGAYAGHHARYELRSRVIVLETSFAEGGAA